MTGGTASAGLALMHGEITREIIGAFYDVYNELGAGFAEVVYSRALGFALLARRVRAERELPIQISFRGESVGEFRADLVVDRKVIVECKCAERIMAAHEAQLINYLRATGVSVGLILNFGQRPSIRRLLLTVSSSGSVVIRS